MNNKTIESQVSRRSWPLSPSPTCTRTVIPRGSAASPHPGGLCSGESTNFLTYHYLVAEVYRVVSAAQLPYEMFWAMSKTQQADHIWKHLFVEAARLLSESLAVA